MKKVKRENGYAAMDAYYTQDKVGRIVVEQIWQNHNQSLEMGITINKYNPDKINGYGDEIFDGGLEELIELVEKGRAFNNIIECQKETHNIITELLNKQEV